MKIIPLLILFILSCSIEPEDCAGVVGGNAELDNCQVCDTDFTNDCIQDCTGVWGGAAAKDCLKVCNGTAITDECGVCDSDIGNDCTQDCAGEWGGLADNCLDWVDCPPCYENSSSMTAIVLDALSGAQMYEENDILAAFDIDGNVRGIALHLYPIPFGLYEGTGLYEIQIRGDEGGDAISFAYYDASEDEVLESGTGYTFVIDDIIGDVVTPHEISVNNGP